MTRTETVPGKTRSSSCVTVVMLIGCTVTTNCESGDACSPSVTVKLKPPDSSPDKQPCHHHQEKKPAGGGRLMEETPCRGASFTSPCDITWGCEMTLFFTHHKRLFHRSTTSMFLQQQTSCDFLLLLSSSHPGGRRRPPLCLSGPV